MDWKGRKKMKKKKNISFVRMCASVWLFNHPKSCNFLYSVRQGKVGRWTRAGERERVAWKFSNKLFLIDIFLFLWPFVFHSFSFIHRASKIREKFLFSTSSSPLFHSARGVNFCYWIYFRVPCSNFSNFFPRLDECQRYF